MPCETVNLSAESKRKRLAALDALRNGLRAGTVTVRLSPSGAIAFAGAYASTPFLADVCAYRALTAEGFAPLRQAVARAEAISGKKLNLAAIAAGEHSHDGGNTWSHH